MPEPRRTIRRHTPPFARYATLAARALTDGVAEGDGVPDGADAREAAMPLEPAVRGITLGVAARRSAPEARAAGPYAGAPAPPDRRTVDRRC